MDIGMSVKIKTFARLVVACGFFLAVSLGDGDVTKQDCDIRFWHADVKTILLEKPGKLTPRENSMLNKVEAMVKKVENEGTSPIVPCSLLLTYGAILVPRQKLSIVIENLEMMEKEKERERQEAIDRKNDPGGVVIFYEDDEEEEKKEEVEEEPPLMNAAEMEDEKPKREENTGPVIFEIEEEEEDIPLKDVSSSEREKEDKHEEKRENKEDRDESDTKKEETDEKDSVKNKETDENVEKTEETEESDVKDEKKEEIDVKAEKKEESDVKAEKKEGSDAKAEKKEESDVKAEKKEESDVEDDQKKEIDVKKDETHENDVKDEKAVESDVKKDETHESDVKNEHTHESDGAKKEETDGNERDDVKYETTEKGSDESAKKIDVHENEAKEEEEDDEESEDEDEGEENEEEEEEEEVAESEESKVQEKTNKVVPIRISSTYANICLRINVSKSKNKSPDVCSKFCQYCDLILRVCGKDDISEFEMHSKSLCDSEKPGSHYETTEHDNVIPASGDSVEVDASSKADNDDPASLKETLEKENMANAKNDELNHGKEGKSKGEESKDDSNNVDEKRNEGTQDAQKFDDDSDKNSDKIVEQPTDIDVVDIVRTRTRTRKAKDEVEKERSDDKKDETHESVVKEEKTDESDGKEEKKDESDEEDEEADESDVGKEKKDESGEGEEKKDESDVKDEKKDESDVKEEKLDESDVKEEKEDESDVKEENEDESDEEDEKADESDVGKEKKDESVTHKSDESGEQERDNENVDDIVTSRSSNKGSVTDKIVEKSTENIDVVSDASKDEGDEEEEEDEDEDDETEEEDEEEDEEEEPSDDTEKDNDEVDAVKSSKRVRRHSEKGVSAKQVKHLRNLIDEKQTEQVTKIQNLELMIIKLENKILSRSLDKQDEKTTYAQLENQILKLENALLKLNRTYQRLHEDHESLKTRSRRKFSYKELEYFQSMSSHRPSELALADAHNKEIITQQQTRMTELTKILSNQTDQLRKLSTKSAELEAKNEKLYHIVLNQTLLISRIMSQMQNLHEDHTHTKKVAEGFKSQIDSLRDTQHSLNQFKGGTATFIDHSQGRSPPLSTQFRKILSRSAPGVVPPPPSQSNELLCRSVDDSRFCLYHRVIILNCVPLSPLMWGVCSRFRGSILDVENTKFLKVLHIRTASTGKKSIKKHKVVENKHKQDVKSSGDAQQMTAKQRKKAEAEARAIQTALTRELPYAPSPTSNVFHDCHDRYKSGQRLSDSTRIFVNGIDHMVNVLCDMTSEGWTVIMKRQNGQEDFYRTFLEYKQGFGNTNDDHYLGNEVIHYLTNQRRYSLRVTLKDWEGHIRTAIYDHFWVDNEDEGFKLHVHGYSGDAGDGLGKHSGMRFSTHDVDNDSLKTEMGGSCAKRFHGAGWYYKCYSSNLMGKYYPDGVIPRKLYDGIVWKPWHGPNYTLNMVELAVKPIAVH